jgi:hypothetical protein
VFSEAQVPIILNLAIPEFVALQRLSDSERRSHFNLPEWCEPTVAARPAGRARVTVIIGCLAEDPPETEDADTRQEPDGGVTNPR